MCENLVLVHVVRGNVDNTKSLQRNRVGICMHSPRNQTHLCKIQRTYRHPLLLILHRHFHHRNRPCPKCRKRQTPVLLVWVELAAKRRRTCTTHRQRRHQVLLEHTQRFPAPKGKYCWSTLSQKIFLQGRHQQEVL